MELEERCTCGWTAVIPGHDMYMCGTTRMQAGAKAARVAGAQAEWRAVVMKDEGAVLTEDEELQDGIVVSQPMPDPVVWKDLVGPVRLGTMMVRVRCLLDGEGVMHEVDAMVVEQHAKRMTQEQHRAWVQQHTDVNYERMNAENGEMRVRIARLDALQGRLRVAEEMVGVLKELLGRSWDGSGTAVEAQTEQLLAAEDMVGALQKVLAGRLSWKV